MLKKCEIKMIHKMHKVGLSKNVIVRKLGIKRDTVAIDAKLLKGYIPVIKRETVETIIHPYLPKTARMLEETHKLGVYTLNTAIFQEIQKLAIRAHCVG